MTAPRAEAGRCSTLSRSVTEPLAGSAPQAIGWVALEQPGAWGAKAWRASGLDPVLGARLEEAATKHGLRPTLIRRPGRSSGPDRTAAEGRQVLVAHCRPGATWLLSGTVTDPAALLALDWAAVAAGDAGAVTASLPGLVAVTEPHLLVCANGKRDACCAIVGRPVAAAASLTHPDRVWEATHLGGHRFAPTAVVLPTGWTHGRLDEAGAADVLGAAAAGDVVLESARGCSVWPPGGQVADLEVRRRVGAIAGDDITQVHPTGPQDGGVTSWLVHHRDGRRWQVTVSLRGSGRQRPESCGKPAVDLVEHVVTGVRPLTP